MILGTHNTMTYLNPQWWMRPFKWTAKCQSKNYIEQYNLGVRLFDLRFKFNKNGKPYFAHGLAKYKSIDIYKVLDDLNALSTDEDTIYVKISYEARDNKNYDLFKSLCYEINSEYTNLYFFGGGHSHPTKKYNGEIYHFNNAWPEPLIGKHASWNNDLADKRPSGYLIDDLCPRLYAWLNNKKNINRFKNENVFLMIDFVGCEQFT